MNDRKTFWPTVLVGAAGSAIASVSASRDWATASAQVAGVTSRAAGRGSEAVPLALALALVALAAWGAILVVRRRARRVVAGLGLLAAVGVLVATATGATLAKDDAVAGLAGQTGSAASLTGWFAATLVGAAAALIASGFALAKLGAWPEMATRYDAPGGPERASDPTDLWKSLDEGHDPTL